MPPRHSKRLKSAPQELSSDNDLNSAEAINTKGLPILPDELYLEIISYYPVSPIPQQGNHYPDVKDQNVRRQVLFALSQTSLNLRRFFLPYLWQRIEVCRIRYAPMKNRTLALELVRQLEIVTIRDPTLAKYVEIVNVEIGAYSRSSVLSELARCLALFPDLHTVQLKIEGDTEVQQDTVAKPFKGHVYENIRTAVVSSNAVAFLRSCPQSRYVDSYEDRHLDFFGRIFGRNTFWDAVIACCPRIEVAPRNNPILSGKILEIARALPDIRNLTLLQHQVLEFNRVDQLVVSRLIEFRRLKVLTIVDISDDERGMNFKGPPSRMCYEIAKKLLLDLQRIDKEDKVFVLKFRTGERNTVVLQYREPSLV